MHQRSIFVLEQKDFVSESYRDLGGISNLDEIRGNVGTSMKYLSKGFFFSGVSLFSSSFKLRPPGNQVFKVTAKSVQKHIYTLLSLAFSATNNIYTKGFQFHSWSPSIHSCSFALKARSDGYKVK